MRIDMRINFIVSSSVDYIQIIGQVRTRTSIDRGEYQVIRFAAK